MGRRSIWANSEIIDLTRKFAVATDEVWRLQNLDDPECIHFRKIADVGHYRAHRTTRQGIYVCTPSGILLGSLNTHSVEKVKNLLLTSLKKYDELETDERRLENPRSILPDHRWEQSKPAKGLELTMYARDLPTSGKPDDNQDSNWNQDRVWFSKSEARQFLPEDLSRLQADQMYSVPANLVARIAKFSIVDTVKGQTTHYSFDEVKQSKLSATVKHFDEATIQLNFVGQTQAASKGSRNRDMPHGIQTNLLGTALFDRQEQNFVQFEIVAVGTRWGRTVFNGRSKQLEQSPVGFAFQMTPPDAPLIAPSFLYAYDAKWVKRPKW